MRGFKEVDWERAACLGVPTNLFYVFEEHRTVKEFFNVTIVKKICFACPIWRSCLLHGLQNEDYGVWGGLTTKERDALVTGEPSNLFTKVTAELLENAISITEIQGVLDEHSRNERSLAYQASDE